MHCCACNPKLQRRGVVKDSADDVTAIFHRDVKEGEDVLCNFVHQLQHFPHLGQLGPMPLMKLFQLLETTPQLAGSLGWPAGRSSAATGLQKPGPHNVARDGGGGAWPYVPSGLVHSVNIAFAAGAVPILGRQGIRPGIRPHTRQTSPHTMVHHQLESVIQVHLEDWAA